MAIPIEAIPKYDPDNGFVRVFRRESSRIVAQTSYLITGTNDPVVAAGATGLPARGTPLPGFAGVTVQNIDIEPFTVPHDVTGIGAGTCRAVLTYSTIQTGSGILRVPESPDDRWTVMDVGSRDVQIYEGAPGGDVLPRTGLPSDIPLLGAYGGPINQGDGTTRPVATLTARVFIHKNPTGYVLPLPDIIERLNTVNGDPLTLPPIAGLATPLSIGVGQAVFAGFTPPELINGILQIVYTFQIALNHFHIWEILNPDGGVAGKRYASLYTPTALSPLLV